MRFANWMIIWLLLFRLRACKNGLRPRFRCCGLGANRIDTGQSCEHFSGDVHILLKLAQAIQPLLKSTVFIALLRESRLGFRAAVAQCRINVATEQRRYIHLHGFTPKVVLIDLTAIDLAVAIFREQNRHLRPDSRAPRTVRFAVALILYLNLAVGATAIDIAQAEAQALHPYCAPLVIENGKPRFPFAGDGDGGFFPSLFYNS